MPSTETATEKARRLGREIMDAELRKRGLIPRSEPVPIAKVETPAAAAGRALVRAPGPGAAGSGKTLAELDAELAAVTATNKALEAEQALAKRDVATAKAIFAADPRAYDAYHARLRGGEYQVPVAKAAEPDRRAEIRKLLTEGDHAGLGELLRSGPYYDQYLEVANEPATLAATAEVRKAGGATDVRRKLLELHAKLDGSLEAARAFARLQRTPEGQKAWQALVAEGKVKVAA